MQELIDRDALLKDMGLTDAVKYGNKDSEQLTRSYSTWMSYEIADAIQDAPAVNRWISVEDALPEKAGEYLVTYHPCFWDDVEWSKRCVGIDTFRGKTTWAKKKFQRVTHWMPLPEPPEVTQDE